MCEKSFNEESGTKPAIPPCSWKMDSSNCDHIWPLLSFRQHLHQIWLVWQIVLMVVTQVYFDTFLKNCYIVILVTPVLAFIWRWSVKAAKCAWSFVARQTGALRYTEVDGDDVGGAGVDEYDDADDFDGIE